MVVGATRYVFAPVEMQGIGQQGVRAEGLSTITDEEHQIYSMSLWVPSITIANVLVLYRRSEATFRVSHLRIFRGRTQIPQAVSI